MTTLDEKLNGLSQRYMDLDARVAKIESRYGSDTDKTQLEYQSLFTLAELVAIEVAAETDPTLRVLQRMQQAATYISLADPRTLQGMQYLVSVGILTQARYDEIIGHTYDA